MFNTSADGRVPKAWEGRLLEELERYSRAQNLGVARGVSFSNLRKTNSLNGLRGTNLNQG